MEADVVNDSEEEYEVTHKEDAKIYVYDLIINYSTKTVNVQCISIDSMEVFDILKGHLESEISLDPVVTVKLQILSNWGHPQRVGLTEVQFFDANRQPLTVVSLGYGDWRTEDVKGDLKNLVNGKTKTVKEKFMWSSAFTTHEPKEIVFHVKGLETGWLQHTGGEISAEPTLWLGIWNFNKSLKDLDIGVKDIRVVVDYVIAYEGRIEKGCGNQVFEYGQFLALDIVGNPVSVPILIYPEDVTSQTFKQHWNMTSPHDRRLADNEHPLEPSGWPAMDKCSAKSVPILRDSSDCSSVCDNYAHLEQPCENTDCGTARNRPTWFGALEKNSPPLKLPVWLKNYETGMKEGTDSRSTVDRGFPLESEKVSNRAINSKNYSSDDIVSSRQSSGRRSGCLSRVDNNEPIRQYQSTDLDRTEELLYEGIFPSVDGEWPKRETSARFGRRAMSACNAQSKEEEVRSATSKTSEGASTMLDKLANPTNAFVEEQCRGTNRDKLGRDSLDTYFFKADTRIKKTPNRNLTAGQVVKNASSPSDADFVIPELPKGRQLVINIKTTWGDRHYVGLNGVELFGSTGELACIEKIVANPADINVLPEYSKDPRVVTNLINGVYRTKDDTNVWLAPFTPGEDHIITITFKESVELALVRIWNYNKSRIHSFRGAKDVEITLDEQYIFKGEIAKACGTIVGGPEAFGDTILFTLDDDILERIAINDENFLEPSGFCDYEDRCSNVNTERPPTSSCELGSRPYTAANVPEFERVGHKCGSPSNSSDESNCPAIQGRNVELSLCTSWGDAKCIGLTAVELIDVDDEALEVLGDSLSLSGAECDQGSEQPLHNLFNGVNITTDHCEMWQTRLTDTGPVSITITFEETRFITALRLWNYNASLEDSYCGVKQLAVKIDGQLVSPPEGYLIRRAPGNCHFDFAQQISFVTPSVFETDVIHESLDDSYLEPTRTSPYQEYEPMVMPRGFVFQLQLLSTWGDQYYVGLNGLEMFDPLGNKIPLSEGEVAAYPDSVNVLDGISDDVRTPDKLVDGVNDTRDGRHMWLAPILPGVINRVYIIFDYPMTVSMVKLWNYAKTPSRGVKEFAIVVDDLLIYHGVLGQTWPDTNRKVPYRTVVFTADQHIFQNERHTVIRNDDIGQDVQMTNDSQIVHKSKSNDSVDQALRPFTSLPPKGSSRHKS